MPVQFTPKDLKIFSIMDFKARMTALKEEIRPKLEALGEVLAPQLAKKFDHEFWPHTAKHMRRSVNPPDETWVALGPEKRGYKAYVYFAFCIGKAGAQARVVMKQESKMRPNLGRNLIANQETLSNMKIQLKGLCNYLKREQDYQGQSITDLSTFVEKSGERLLNLKSATFDVGLPLDWNSPQLSKKIINSFQKLYPFFACGLQKRVQL